MAVILVYRSYTPGLISWYQAALWDALESKSFSRSTRSQGKGIKEGRVSAQCSVLDFKAKKIYGGSYKFNL